MKKSSNGAILLLMLAVMIPASASACECVLRRQAMGEDLPPVAEQLAQADFVFHGKVARVDDAVNNSTALLDIVKSWKGDGRERIRISMQTSCDTYFVQGEEYLIYATGERQGNVFTASKCGRTRPIAEAQEDLKQLGAPQAQQ